MRIDISNPVLKDILLEVCKDDKREIIISDKDNKLHKKGVFQNVPVVIYKPNIYKGFEYKILDYMNNIEAYQKLGIENVEQYLCYVLFKKQRAVGIIHDIGKAVDDYISKRADINNMGFYNVSSYIEYVFSVDKSDNLTYSLSLEYEKCKREAAQKGIHSLNDYIKYNNMLSKAVITYEEKEISVNKNDFLNFELRQFAWTKEYILKKGTLKGIQKYINKMYISETIIPKEISSLDFEYVQSPAYYFENFEIKNISEFIEWQRKINSIEDKYISLKAVGKMNLNKIDYIKSQLNIMRI